MTGIPKRPRGRPRKHPVEPVPEKKPIVFHTGDVVDCGIPGQSIRGVIISRRMVGGFWVVQTKTGHHLYLPEEMRKVDDDG